MANNLRDELSRLMMAHTTKKAEEARLAKQTQQRIEEAERHQVLENAAEVEVPNIIEGMRENARDGRNGYIYDLGLVTRDTYTNERASVIEAALRAGGITKIVRKREQRRAPYLDDLDTHMVMEIGW